MTGTDKEDQSRRRRRGWQHGGHPDRPTHVFVPPKRQLAIRKQSPETDTAGHWPAPEHPIVLGDSVDKGGPRDESLDYLEGTRGPTLVHLGHLEEAWRKITGAWGDEAVRGEAGRILQYWTQDDPVVRELHLVAGIWRVGPVVRGTGYEEVKPVALTEGEPDSYLFGDLVFETLGGICPEQMDVWLADDPRSETGTAVAYVRLRHGTLTATMDFARPGEKEILRHEGVENCGSGEFNDERTRRLWIGRIAQRVEAERRARREQAA